MAGHNSYPVALSVSALIAPSGYSKRLPVRLHSAILTETGGSSVAVLKLYVPTQTGNAASPTDSASGTQVGTINVPAGLTLVLPYLGEEGIFFAEGLYIAVSGGTLAGTLVIS